MDPHAQGDGVQLLDYKARRRGRGKNYRGDSLEMLSDSELAKKERPRSGWLGEDTTVFSDTYDENLPSVRAHIAASRRHQESLQTSQKVNKETTPLLNDTSEKKGVEAMSTNLTENLSKMEAHDRVADSRKSRRWERVKMG